MRRRLYTTSMFIACLLFAVIAAAMGSRAYGQGPRVKVTVVPHAGAGGPEKTELISGTVSGVDFGTHRIVIYAFAGGTWWVQPASDSALTTIDESGSWQTITHLGSVYAVLVVKEACKPPATTANVPSAKGDVLKVELIPGR